MKEDIQLINAQRNDHELIKTITPDNSPKKSAPLFPRPVKKEPSNHHPITDMFDKDVISKIFLF